MRILLGGNLYGYHNIGDEAIAESNILSFSQYADLTVITREDYWLTKEYGDVSEPYISKLHFFKIRTIKDFIHYVYNLASYMKQYRKSDLFCLGGATALSDFPYHCLGEVIAAKIYGRRSFAWGCGFCTVEDKNTAGFIKRVLNDKTVIKIFVRDEFCIDRLCAIGVDRNKLDYCYDPVLMLDGADFDRKAYFEEKEIAILENGKKNIVVGISGEKEALGKMDNSRIVYMIKKLSEIGNIVLMPTGFVKNCSDFEYMSNIKNLLMKENVILVKKELRPRHLIRFLEDMDVVVSSRLHLTIFSTCACTPFIALERSTKNSDYAKLVGTECFPLNEMDPDAIIDATSKKLKDKNGERNRIRQIRDKMRRRHIEVLNDFFGKELHAEKCKN